MCSRSNGVAVLWLEQVADDVPPHDEWLGEREREVVRGLRFAKRRGEWRLGRWTAKRAVAAALGIDAGEIEILAAVNGVPEAWTGGARAPVSLSLSHSAGRALCCVAREKIALGCDLERIEPRSASFASDYLTSEELYALSGPRLPEADRRGAPSGIDQTVAINLYWSAKESALKALGEGLRLDTRSLYVEADAREGACAPSWHALRVNHESGRIFEGWWQSGGGFVRTIVACPAPALPASASGFHGSETRATQFLTG